MSVNHHISPFMNRCRLLAMLLMLALALPMIGQTTYTYKKSKGKSLRDLQTNSLGGYQKQAAHEDRVVIYRKPSSDSITLWRNAEGFVSYARWYDYTNDQSISNITLWRSGSGDKNNNNSGTQSDTYQTDNHGVIWYCTVNNQNQIPGKPYQANAKYVYNPTSNDNQVVYIACDQSSYTDWSIDGNTFTEPTISQRMVFEIRPASEMADSIENVYNNDEWLEEYDIMAPTGQNLFVGPKYAFKYEETKSGDKEYANVTVGESYPAYFYMDSNGSVQQMNTNGFSGNNSSSVIGNWKKKNSYLPTTTIIYVCNST